MHCFQHQIIQHQKFTFSKVYAEDLAPQYLEYAYQFYNIQYPIKFHNFKPKKKLEFLLGRIALYHQQQCYDDYFNLKNGQYGQPLWPDPFLGSISHTMINERSGVAIATLNIDQQHIGIDIELKRNTSFFIENSNFLNQFLHESEQYQLQSFSKYNSLFYLIIFSAKESVIKAICSQQHIILNFHDIQFYHYDYLKQKMTFKVSKTLKISVNYRILEQEIITYCML